MILDLDIGNTRCKWKVPRADNTAFKAGHCSLEQLWLQDFGEPDPRSVRRIRVACVRADDARRAIVRWCVERFDVEPEFAVSEAFCGGVTNAYREPRRLGVDRWLAMLAAYSELRGALCVFDCGSAITADLVDANGKHLGGYIAPGLHLMRNSLIRKTDGVRFQSVEEPIPMEPGRDTDHAVASGTMLSALGLLGRIAEMCDSSCRIAQFVFTGGDGKAMRSALGISSIYREHLVLDGLSVALP